MVFNIGFILSDPEFWWLLLIFLIIGLIIIAAIGFLLAFPIASLAAIAVFFFTGSLFWSGVTFLIVALLVAAIGGGSRRDHEHHTHVYHEH